jgi:hypothetical protein
MEIVEAESVREALFDPDTGRPIRQMVEATSVAGPAVTPSLSPATTGAADANTTTKDAEELLDDFPIDLEVPN